MAASNTSIEISRRLTSIEAKLDTFIDQLARHDERTTALSKDQGEMKADVAKLETRTRKVENRQLLASGAAGAFGTFIGWLSNGLFPHHG